MENPKINKIMINLDKTCSFLGHRKIVKTKNLERLLKSEIENLIVNFGVNVFLFGSRSEFNSFCHQIVTELKEQYPFIKRVFYTCQSEKCIFEKDLIKYEQLYLEVVKREVKLLAFEEEYEYKTKYTAGKASYIERNMAMINDSDYCIFYYDKILSQNYKSGTEIAYNYAKRKNKNIINLYI